MIDACLWGGVAEACKQEIERRKAWKRRKGRWYARGRTHRMAGARTLDRPPEPLEHVATDSKDDAAEVAARNLIRRYADLFTERTAVRVDIHPEIEWQPPED